ncbi:MAG: stage II sporulation protein D [Clostridia bacterium]|nr:stage II sporulation protein D [Clostridia bacterium]
MEIIQKIAMIDGKEKLVIYVSYPSDYEFGLDFDSLKKKVKDITTRIKEYIKTNIDSFSDDSALLILNGIVVGTLVFSQIKHEPFESISLNDDTQIVASLNEEDNQDSNKNEVIPKKEVDVNYVIESEQTRIINSSASGKLEEPIEKPVVDGTSNTVSKPNFNGNSNANSNTGNTTNNTNSSKIISVKLSSGTVIKLGLEDYVIGVVGSEMPALFNSEALKAQAVAARTYALKKTSSGATLSATTADQVYKTDAQLRTQWGGSFNTYYTKVKNAVLATSGQCMTYSGQYIDAVYFSTSNGMTEDPVNVWGGSVPYLKPVQSKWDVGVRGFSQSKTIPMSVISQKLGVNLTSASQISINSRTAGNRVNNVTFVGKAFNGAKVRSLLGLRSADFSVSQSGNSIVFTTKGYGHGVGMSQYGANEMAKAGYSYSQILKHYYTGISIIKK